MTPLTQTKLLSFKDNFKSLVNLSLRGSLPNKLIFSGNKFSPRAFISDSYGKKIIQESISGSYNNIR